MVVRRYDVHVLAYLPPQNIEIAKLVTTGSIPVFQPTEPIYSKVNPK